LSWAWWCIHIIPALQKLRQEDPRFKASLGYILRTVSKKKSLEFEN
jgi:hypothetical protein